MRILRAVFTVLFLAAPIAISPAFSGSVSKPWVAYIIGALVGTILGYVVGV